MPGTYEAAQLSDGSYVVNNASVGFPLQIWSPSGELVREFGRSDSVRTPDAGWRNWREITVATDGTIWTATRYYDYVIQNWDSTGEMLSDHRLDRTWFLRYDSVVFPAPDKPPSPAVSDLWLDDERLLWTVSEVAASAWATGLERDDRFGDPVYRIDRPQFVFDLQIDAIDPVSAELHGSRRISGIGAPADFIEPGMLATRRTDDDGWWFVDVWRVSMESSQ